MQVHSLGSLSGLRIWCSCKLQHSCRWGLDLALLCLWCRLATAALIWPLAWEHSYATCVDIKRKQKTRLSIQGSGSLWRHIVSICFLGILDLINDFGNCTISCHDFVYKNKYPTPLLEILSFEMNVSVEMHSFYLSFMLQLVHFSEF